MEISLSEVNDVLGDIRNLGEAKKDFLNFKNVSIDSRTLLKTDLFIAIKGKNFDGHSFLPEVIKKGPFKNYVILSLKMDQPIVHKRTFQLQLNLAMVLLFHKHLYT